MFISRMFNLTKAEDVKLNTLLDVAYFTLKHDWSPFLFKDGYRHGSSWSTCDLMVFDVDNDGQDTCTLEEAKERFKEYSYVILASKSHQIEKNGKIADRFRVIIPLTMPIVDKEIYKNTWFSLSNQFPFIDQQCKDFARFYYKSKLFICENKGRHIDPVTVDVVPNIFKKPQLDLLLNKGKLSRATMEFIIHGLESGGRNIACYKAAKDMQEQGYDVQEAIAKLVTSPCVKDDFSESEVEQTVLSAYSNDPRHDPRGLSEKSEYIARNVADLENDPELYKRNETINGPDFLDLTQEKWRKGEVLGIVAGSGSGKSAVSLKIIKDIIANNHDNDDIHFFFSLEMPARQIVKRWHKLVGKDHKNSTRLYVIDNNNTEERLTWQHIVKYVEDTCKFENKKVGCVIIDHMMVLSDKIDTTMEPNFDVSLDINSGRGKIKTIRTKEMCRLMKVVADRLACFLIVQNQSTIERAGHGDTPMGINAAYGAADFAWFSDYIITVWQPLKRVQHETSITGTGWQYSKIREVGLNDLTRTYTRHGLYYDLGTGDFRPFTEIEYQEFQKLSERADALRGADEKKKGIKYEQNPVCKSRQHLISLKGGKTDE